MAKLRGEMRRLEGTGGGPGVFAPLVVIRPMPRLLGSVNQRLLSGPVVIAVGSATAPLEAAGLGNSGSAVDACQRQSPMERVCGPPVVVKNAGDAAGVGDRVLG